MNFTEVSPPQESSQQQSPLDPLNPSNRENPDVLPSSSASKPTLAEDYSRTFQRLLEEKEAIIEDLFLENQRLTQNQEIKRVLSPKSLSPEFMSPKEMDYKRLLDLENIKTDLEKKVKELEREFLKSKRQSRDNNENEGIIENLQEENLNLRQINGDMANLQQENKTLRQINADLEKKGKDMEKEQLFKSKSQQKGGFNENNKEIIESLKQENLNLKQKLQKLNQETMIMSRRLEKPQENIESEEESIAEISKLKAKISQMKFQEEQNMQEIARLSHLNQELLENKSNYSFELLQQSSLSSSGNRAKRELELLKSVNNDLENKIAALLHNESVLGHRIEGLSIENQRLLAENDEEFAEGMKRKIMELESRVYSVSDENIELKAAKKEAENLINQMKDLKEALSRELEREKVEKQERIRDLENLNGNNRDLQRRIEELEEKERNSLDKQAILEELNELRGIIGALRAEKIKASSEMKANFDMKLREIEELSRYVKDLEERLEAYESENMKLQAEIEINQGEMREMKREIEMKGQKLEFYAEEIQSYLLRIEQIEFKKNEQEIIIKDLEERRTEEALTEKVYSEEKDQLFELIKGLKAENLSQNEKFNEILNIKECHLRFLKEKFADDVKELITRFNKNPNIDANKALEMVKESSYVVTHKEAVIKQMKDKTRGFQAEIKDLKDKNKGLHETLNKLPKNKIKLGFYESQGTIGKINPQENQENFLMINKLESQVFSMKLEMKKLQEELNFRKDLLEVSEEKIKEKDKEITVLRERGLLLEKDLNESRKNHKFEINDLMNQNQTLYQEKQGIREEYSQDAQENETLMAHLKEADQALSQSKEEILRKNNMIQALKLEMQELQEDLSKSQEIVQRFADESEKMKKNMKETVRKDQTYRLFQEKLDQSKVSEKQWNDEKNSLNEKLKLMKTDLQRKEAFNKELKEKLDQALMKLENCRSLQEENEKLKENLKKLKNEIERKETSLGLLRGKLDDFLTENNQLKSSKISNLSTDHEKENKRLEFTKNSLKKSESQAQMLLYLVKRLFREIYTNVKKLKNRTIIQNNSGSYSTNSKGFDERTLSESLNILKLSPNELNEFLQPKGDNYNKENDDKLMEKFEAEIMDVENMNINEIYSMIYGIIEERIKLEKKL